MIPFRNTRCFNLLLSLEPVDTLEKSLDPVNFLFSLLFSEVGFTLNLLLDSRNSGSLEFKDIEPIGWAPPYMIFTNCLVVIFI